MIRLQKDKKILLIRPSAMGDIVMASPMLAALRQKYPAAHLAWLVEPGFVDLLQHNPDLDEVIVWPKAQWLHLLRHRHYLKLWQQIRQFRQALRSREFDLAIDAVGLAKSRFLLWLSGARERIGFVSKEPGSFLLTRKVDKPRNDPQMSSEYSAMMSALDIAGDGFHPAIVVSAADQVEARALLGQLGVRDRYVVLAPFTTRPQKHWFDERWSELADSLHHMNLDVVILGGPGDREHGSRILAATRAGGHNLSGKCTLGQSAAVIEQAALLIGVDTGLTHMGTAFDRPTIALFGSTCPYLTTPSPLTHVLYKPYPCSPCRRSPTCDDRFDCMASLTVADIVTLASHLLTQSGHLS